MNSSIRLGIVAGIRRKVTNERLQGFMRELASLAQSPGNVYFTGGATALLLGFRDQTIDIDIKIDPEPKGVFEAIAVLKNRLDLNIELASPDNFIPAGDHWRENSVHIATIGPVHFFHYDFALQALAKLERGHTQDLEDVRSFLQSGYVQPEQLCATFSQIEAGMIRYPAIDSKQFKVKVESFLKALQKI